MSKNKSEQKESLEDFHKRVVEVLAERKKTPRIPIKKVSYSERLFTLVIGAFTIFVIAIEEPSTFLALWLVLTWFIMFLKQLTMETMSKTQHTMQTIVDMQDGMVDNFLDQTRQALADIMTKNNDKV